MVDGRRVFTMEQYERTEDDGVGHLERRYLDAQGNVVYRETAMIVDGVQRTQHSVDRQESKEGRLRIEESAVEYWLSLPDGTNRSERVRVRQPALGSTGLVPFIVRDANWSQLLNGKTIELNYLSWSKQKNYAFTLQAENPDAGDSSTFAVVMRPSAWVVRQLFDEIRYVFRRADRRLLEYHGRVSVRAPSENGYEDINDAIVRFSYPGDR